MSRLVEEWRDIAGYEGLYQVSDWGNVRSLDRIINTKKEKRCYKGRMLKLTNKADGYVLVSLWDTGKGKDYRVHRLVAEAFIPNPENKPHVDHIDGDRSNNCVWNLRWCTQSENNNFELYRARQKNKKNCSKMVYQYTLEGALIKTYPSTMEVERTLGFKNAIISYCCRGGRFRKGKWISRKSYKGYIWSYVPL